MSVCLALLLATSACQSSDPLFRPERARTLREAGSVHLTVLAVARWSEYVSAMQPDFALSADGALARVTADSRWQTSDRTRTVQLGQESVVLDRASGGSRPLEVPGFKPAEIAPPPVQPPVGVPASPGQEPATGPDAMLKYSAATALFQEVQLLNRYIRDAAIPNGYRPYMVRLQVTLMPSRRHAPYDAYTTLSFFVPGERGEDGGTLAESGRVSSSSNHVFAEPFGNAPKVLPLLVTDNLEASVQARSLERMRSLVYSMLKFPGLSVIEQMDTGLLHEFLRDQVLGRDLNSLLTVARISENTLRIRLGAVQEATSNYAMVPRNHNVTLLVMVPEGAPALMEVVSRTELVDADSGRGLAAPESGDERRLLHAYMRRVGLDEIPGEQLDTLHQHARANDQRGFTATLRAVLPADHPALGRERALWIDLVSMLAGGPYDSQLFELPGHGEDTISSEQIFEQQTIVVEDDGILARVVLREARFPEFEQVLAVLAAPQSEPPLILPARSVGVDPSRRELRAEFPSPQRWNLDVDPSRPLELRLTFAGELHAFPALYRQVTALE